MGKKHQARLKKIGVFTAYEFTQLPLAWVRKEMTVVGERLWRELRGESCIEFRNMPKSKKAIGTSKSFGKKLEDLPRIEEACAYYISEVAEVLRAQKSCATYIQVFVTTNRYSDTDKQYSNSCTITIAVPTNNTFILTQQARKALQRIYKPGYRYKKVGVNLTGLIPQEYVQGNLFESPTLYDKRLMNVIDALNHKFGKATVGSALVGTRVAQWELVKKDRSKRYTTQWDDLLELKNK